MRQPGSALVILILLAGCGTRYALDKTSMSVPALRMTGAIVASRGTRITFEYAPDAARRVGVHAPGQDGAFTIQSLDRKQTYKLTAVDGIAIDDAVLLAAAASRPASLVKAQVLR
jgi:hypothetical protein